VGVVKSAAATHAQSSSRSDDYRFVVTAVDTAAVTLRGHDGNGP